VKTKDAYLRHTMYWFSVWQIKQNSMGMQLATCLECTDNAIISEKK